MKGVWTYAEVTAHFEKDIVRLVKKEERHPEAIGIFYAWQSLTANCFKDEDYDRLYGLSHGQEALDKMREYEKLMDAAKAEAAGHDT